MFLKILNKINRIGATYIKQSFEYKKGIGVDLYLNTFPTKNICIHFIYGGRWTTGKKEDFQFVAYKLLKAGYHVSIADYRKHPHVKFPSFVEDIAQSFVYINNYFKNYTKNSPYMYVMGHSSGAHLGAMISTDPKYLAEAGGDIELIQGFIGISGPYKFIDYISANDDLNTMFAPPETYKDSQPILLVKNIHNSPPMLLIHAVDDAKVSHLNTELLDEAVKEKSYSETLSLSGLGHKGTIAAFGLPFWPKKMKLILERVNAFTEKTKSSSER